MERKALTIYDLEALNDAAEEVVTAVMRYRDVWFDEEGHDLRGSLNEKERKALADSWLNHLQETTARNPLDFRCNTSLRSLSFHDALELTYQEIKENYLKDRLTKARNILRRGEYDGYYVVSDEVPDSYLEDLIALRWKENLKLWTMQWDHDKEDKEDTE